MQERKIKNLYLLTEETEKYERWIALRIEFEDGLNELLPLTDLFKKAKRRNK